ncbi:sphingomyelin phosphodiesterase 4, neutral membrane (neutral sphingomyelinase-3), partial [Quaeritorhiza haematococci]
GIVQKPLSRPEQKILYDLLAPDGIFLKVILRLYPEPSLLYEIMLDKLPNPIQKILRSLDYSSLPSMYQSKLHVHDSIPHSPSKSYIKGAESPMGHLLVGPQKNVKIMFNMFEYYIFCFAYVVTLSQIPMTDDPRRRFDYSTEPMHSRNPLSFISSHLPSISTPFHWAGSASSSSSSVKSSDMRLPYAAVDPIYYEIVQAYLDFFLPRDSSAAMIGLRGGMMGGRDQAPGIMIGSTSPTMSSSDAASGKPYRRSRSTGRTVRDDDGGAGDVNSLGGAGGAGEQRQRASSGWRRSVDAIMTGSVGGVFGSGGVRSGGKDKARENVGGRAGGSAGLGGGFPKQLNIFTVSESDYGLARRLDICLAISEFVVGTFVDLWLGQNDYFDLQQGVNSVPTTLNRNIIPGTPSATSPSKSPAAASTSSSSSSSFAIPPVYIQPSPQQMRCLALLVRHLVGLDLRFGYRSGDLGGVGSGGGLLDIGVEDAYVAAKRTAYQSFRTKLYWFLRLAFKHWPMDDSFSMVVDLWLTYITPWRAVNPEQAGYRQSGAPSDDVITDDWLSFIMDNFMFYTRIFRAFMERAVHFNILAAARPSSLTSGGTSLVGSSSSASAISPLLSSPSSSSSARGGVGSSSSLPRGASVPGTGAAPDPGTTPAGTPYKMARIQQQLQLLEKVFKVFARTEGLLDVLRGMENALFSLDAFAAPYHHNNGFDATGTSPRSRTSSAYGGGSGGASTLGAGADVSVMSAARKTMIGNSGPAIRQQILHLENGVEEYRPVFIRTGRGTAGAQRDEIVDMGNWLLQQIYLAMAQLSSYLPEDALQQPSSTTTAGITDYSAASTPQSSRFPTPGGSPSRHTQSGRSTTATTPPSSSLYSRAATSSSPSSPSSPASSANRATAPSSFMESITDNIKSAAMGAINSVFEDMTDAVRSVFYEGVGSGSGRVRSGEGSLSGSTPTGKLSSYRKGDRERRKEVEALKSSLRRLSELAEMVQRVWGLPLPASAAGAAAAVGGAVGMGGVASPGGLGGVVGTPMMPPIAPAASGYVVPNMTPVG